MATNSVGNGKANVTTTVPVDDKKTLQKLADDAEMSLNEFCREVLHLWIDGGQTFEKSPPKIRKAARLK